MDPNQERREACRVCGGWLPKRKSTFCSDGCAKRWRRWRDSRKGVTSKFLCSVEEPVWVERDRQAEVKVRDGVHSAGGKVLLVRSGRVVAWGAPGELSWMQRSFAAREQLRIVAKREESAAKAADERAARAFRRAQKFSEAGSSS